MRVEYLSQLINGQSMDCFLCSMKNRTLLQWWDSHWMGFAMLRSSLDKCQSSSTTSLSLLSWSLFSEEIPVMMSQNSLFSLGLGLHIEMAAWNCLCDILANSGRTETLSQSGFATPGVTDYFLAISNTHVILMKSPLQHSLDWWMILFEEVEKQSLK